MLYEKREKFKKLEIKIGKSFSKLNLTPNQWTLSSLLFVLLSFYFIITNNFILAFLAFLFTSLIDFIDGAVARATNTVSVLGGYLDTIVDRIVEFLIILALFFSEYPPFFLSSKTWLLLLLFGSFMTTYTKAAAVEKGLRKDGIKGGLVERGERMILLLLIIFLSTFSKKYASFLIAVSAVLTNLSALQRFLIVIKR